MASLRERFTVAWDDRDPVTVTTTVQDLIDAVEDVAGRGYTNNRVALETALIYRALVRSGHDLAGYDEWINLVDNYDKVNTNGATAGGPTDPGPPGTEPSSSPASRARRGGRGSAGTPGPSKPPSSS